MIDIFDHIVVLTHDIEATAQLYADAGFTVTHRLDAERDYAEHRLVSFQDGSYLELFTFDETHPGASTHRWRPMYEIADGYCDYSVATSDIDRLASRWDELRLPRSPVQEGGKLLQDGREWRLKVALLGVGQGDPALPFVLEDLTPREIRVAGSRAHRNGTTGIRSVTIVTDRPEDSHMALGSLTGTAEPDRRDDPEGELVVYSFGEREIALLKPSAGSSAAERLADAGTVVYRIGLTGSADSPKRIEVPLANTWMTIDSRG